MAFNLPLRLRSTRIQFVALIFLAQFVAVLLVLLFMRAASEEILLGEQQALVAELRNGLVAEYESGGMPSLVDAINDRLAFRHGQISVILFTSANGSVLAGNLDAWPPTIAPNENWQVMNLYRTGSREPERIGLMATALPDGSHLLTGHVIEGGLQLRRVNQTALFVALLVALPLSFAAAMVLGQTIERRIGAIARTAADVSSGNLRRRVETRGTGDAFDSLGEEINNMLARIEQLVGELRLVTDGLAHDLRSPVTRLNSIIERAIAETDDQSCLAALDKVSEEAKNLLAMLTTALQISRAEAGIGRDHFSPVNLQELLADIVEIYGPLAEDRGFELSGKAQSDLVLSMHRELVSQALGNLVENALSHAVAGDTIRLTAGVEAGKAILQVADNGSGIPEGLRNAALRRFGRLDPSRHVSGSGLGLALVEAVARLHGGSVELDDNHPGLVVRIILPAHQPSGIAGGERKPA